MTGTIEDEVESLRWANARLKERVLRLESDYARLVTDSARAIADEEAQTAEVERERDEAVKASVAIAGECDGLREENTRLRAELAQRVTVEDVGAVRMEIVERCEELARRHDHLSDGAGDEASWNGGAAEALRSLASELRGGAKDPDHA